MTCLADVLRTSVHSSMSLQCWPSCDSIYPEVHSQVNVPMVFLHRPFLHRNGIILHSSTSSMVKQKKKSLFTKNNYQPCNVQHYGYSLPMQSLLWLNLKPSKQLHLNEPTLLRQVPLLHTFGWRLHSSTSTQVSREAVRVYPLWQLHWKLPSRFVHSPSRQIPSRS